MPERAPNGYFVRDLIVFNHLRRGGYVSKGFIFESPDLTNSPKFPNSPDITGYSPRLEWPTGPDDATPPPGRASARTARY